MYKLILKYFKSKCICGVRIKVNSSSATCAVVWNAVAVATSPPAAAVDQFGGGGGGGGFTPQGVSHISPNLSMYMHNHLLQPAVHTFLSYFVF
jgi:hypothetical protein